MDDGYLWKGFIGNINELKMIIKKKDGNVITLKMNISFFLRETNLSEHDSGNLLTKPSKF